MEFIRSNALLIGLAIGSGIMLLLPMFKKSAGGVPNLTGAEAVTLINRSNALVLDVRDDAEFDNGHIADAVHIPLANLEARLGELKKYKNKPILVNCQRGARAAKACDILRKAEFTQVHNLQGGLNAWVEAKLPIVKKAVKTATKATAKKTVVETPAANDEITKDPS
ncbi:MAG: rhodanese-like domain-containing protein [Methylotenera sp.]